MPIPDEELHVKTSTNSTVAASQQTQQPYKPDYGAPVGSNISDTHLYVQKSQDGVSRDPVKNALDYIGRGFNYSKRDATSASGWFEAIRGEISDEEAMARYSPSQLEQDEINGLQDYEKLHPISAERVVKEIVGVVPYLMQNAADAAPITLGATATGAGAGAMLGGGAVTFSPAVLGAPVTIPAGAGAGAITGAATGFNLGVRSGITYAAGRMAAGAVYRDLRLKGIPRDRALTAALVAGTAGGLIQGWQYGRIPMVVRDQLGKAAVERSGTETMLALAKEMGINLLALNAQTASRIIAESMAGLNLPWKEIEERFKETNLKGAMTIVPITLGIGGAAAAMNRAAAKSKPGGSGDPVADMAATFRDVLTMSKEGENMKLLQMKAELKVAKAKDRVRDLKKDIEDATTEGKPTSTKKLELQVAEEELRIAKTELPVQSLVTAAKGGEPQLKGRVEKSGKDADEIDESEVTIAQAEDELTAAQNRIKDAEFAVEDIQERLYAEEELNPDADLSGLRDLLVRARKEVRDAFKSRRKAEYALVNKQVDEVIDAANSKYFIEKNDPEGKAIKENQEIITDLIRKSPIDKKYQAAFITAVKETQTQRQLIKIADGYTKEKTGEKVPGVRQKIKELILQGEVKDSHKYMHKVLESLKPSNPRAAHRRSRFPAEIQDAISKYELFIPANKKGGFDEPTNAEAWLQKSNEIKLKLAADADVALSKGEMPDPTESFDRELVDTIAGDTLIDYNNPEEVRDLADKVADIADVGKNKLLEEKRKEMVELKALADDFLSDVQGEAKYQIDLDDPRAKTINKFQELMRVGGAPLMPWNILVGHVTQHSKNPKSVERLMILDDLVKTQNAIRDEHDRALEMILGSEKEDTYKNAIRIAQSDKEKDWGEYTSWRFTGNVDADGKPVVEPVTRRYNAKEAEVIQDIMDMRNAGSKVKDVNEKPKMWKGIVYGNKFTFKDNDKNPEYKLAPGEKSFEQLLEEIVSQNPHLGDIAEGGLKYYNDKKIYDRVNELHRKVFGYNAPKVELYTGPRHREGIDYGEDGSTKERLLSGAISMNKKSLVPGSVIEVVQSDKAYVKADFFHNLSRHIHDTENWINMRDAERKLTYVFTRPAVRQAIKRKFESDSGDIMIIIDNQYMMQVGTRSQQHAQKIKWMSFLRSRIGPAFTYGKPLNLVGQVTSIRQMLNYINDDEFNAGVAYANSHPMEVIKTMTALPLWKARYDSYANELVERRQQQGIFGERLDGKLLQTTGLGLTLGDKYVYLVGGFAVRQAYISRGVAKNNELIAAGKEPVPMSAIIQKADSMAQRAINETQGSAIPDQVTNFERGGDAQKMMVMFGKPSIQQGAAASLAVRRALANPTVENLEQAWRVYHNYMLASMLWTAWNSIMFLGWKGLFGEIKDPEIVKELNKVVRSYLFPWLNLPIIGDAGHFVGDRMMLFAEKESGLIPKESLPQPQRIEDFNFQYIPFRVAKDFVITPLKWGAIADKSIKDDLVLPSEVYSALISTIQSWGLLPTAAPLTPVVKGTKPFWVNPEEEKRLRKEEEKRKRYNQ